jgi:hypothetical protein
MAAALIPFIAVATLTLATLLKPSKADGYIPLPVGSCYSTYNT